MKWKLPPRREHEVSELVRQIAETIEQDVQDMASSTGQRRAQCLATILRPFINMQLPNAGPAAIIDRRQKPWRVQCRFGYDDGSYTLDDDGEFDWEVVSGFDAVIELVRACFDDFHDPDGAFWFDAAEFNDKAMKQRFGGLYSNISKGGGEASTRILYMAPDDVLSFVDVTVERGDGENSLDAEAPAKDSSSPGVSRLREMRAARANSKG